jgi:hypothetical protein
MGCPAVAGRVQKEEYPMTFEMIREGIGYAASLVILVSLLMTNVFRLRMINLVGSLFFALYGWLIGSWPVCVINLVIAGIDGWYLVQSLRVSAFFDLQPAESVGPEFLKRFFLYHERDLMAHAPGLTIEDLQEACTCLIFRNLLPVGVFSIRRRGPDADVVIDFMIPEYRDFKAGMFLYKTKRMHFKEQGIKRFHAVARHPSHPKYLQKNGFVREEGVSGGYVLAL